MFLVLISLLLTASLALPVKAQMGGFGRKGMGGERPAGMKQAETPSDNPTLSSDGVERRDHEIKATGLTAAFPAGFACEPVASPYASPHRHDGSKRRGDRNNGLHGGIDLSLKEGTPLLAVASGEVIARGEGGQLEGIFLWLRHAPTDTGLPFWIFSKYQHLSTLPDLKEGNRVHVGQVVARSGGTGTAGGYYGAAGYPHLHLSTHYGPSKEYTVKGMHGSMVQGQGAVLDDPLILYLRDVNTLNQIHDLPEARRKVDIAVLGEDGAVYPAGSTSVWPVRCIRK
ncbi:MAG: M23 family metallopeptidase [Thiobacillus sp.]|nr:M23 family metallopeptidase [Thiobacillus sp.]